MLPISKDVKEMQNCSKVKRPQMPTADYFASQKRLHEELNDVHPISNDAKEMQKQREQLGVMKFSAGLQPEFESIRSKILLVSNFPLLPKYILEFYVPIFGTTLIVLVLLFLIAPH